MNRSLAITALAALASLAATAHANSFPAPPQADAAYYTAPHCEDIRLPVYFEARSARLKPTAVAAIEQALEVTARCEIDAVALRVAEVEGDTAADAETLASAREEALREVLAERGLSPRLKTAASLRITAPARRDGLLPADRAVQMEVQLSAPRAS